MEAGNFRLCACLSASAVLLVRAVHSHLLASLLSTDDPVNKEVDVELLNGPCPYWDAITHTRFGPFPWESDSYCQQQELNVDVISIFTKYLLPYTISPV